ncbi:hypothetical protein F5Y16DRAFT_117114 [Xylariaceae sp. FL0255]|nr:hypothetical protein F5Y16DRAFT_117114 [Xylariaceae sp. FL0255]
MGALFHLQAKEESLSPNMYRSSQFSSSFSSSAHTSDATTRRPSEAIIYPPRPQDVPIQPPKPKKKKGHSTDPFLRDFTLVAEAARRAQMALVTRELEDVDMEP